MIRLNSLFCTRNESLRDMVRQVSQSKHVDTEFVETLNDASRVLSGKKFGLAIFDIESVPFEVADLKQFKSSMGGASMVLIGSVNKEHAVPTLSERFFEVL